MLLPELYLKTYKPEEENIWDGGLVAAAARLVSASICPFMRC